MKRHIHTPLLLLLITTFLAPAELFADIFKTPVRGEIRKLISGDKGSIRLNFDLPAGTQEITLKEIDNKRFYADEEQAKRDMRLFQGTVRKRSHETGRITGVAAHIIDNELFITFHVRRRSAAVQIRASIPGGFSGGPLQGSYIYTPISRTGVCAALLLDDPGSAHAASGGVSTAAATLREMVISADTDYEFYKAFKTRRNTVNKAASRAKNEVRGILNGAEAIYTSQLGVRFKIKSVSTDSGRVRPFSSSSPDTLLRQFRSFIVSRKRSANIDAFHLFTGKNIRDGVIGLAFVGTICRSGEIGNYAFGFTRKASAAVQPLITAHEIGHNLGAQHVDQPNSIMSTFLSADKTQFVAASLSQIQNYIGQYGSCLSPVSSVKKSKKQNKKQTKRK